MLSRPVVLCMLTVFIALLSMMLAILVMPAPFFSNAMHHAQCTNAPMTHCSAQCTDAQCTMHDARYAMPKHCSVQCVSATTRYTNACTNAPMHNAPMPVSQGNVPERQSTALFCSRQWPNGSTSMESAWMEPLNTCTQMSGKGRQQNCESSVSPGSGSTAVPPWNLPVVEPFKRMHSNVRRR